MWETPVPSWLVVSLARSVFFFCVSSVVWSVRNSGFNGEMALNPHALRACASDSPPPVIRSSTLCTSNCGHARTCITGNLDDADVRTRSVPYCL
ncbi:hypothetical protein FB451DRAFT_1295515, partial [Mycena latifolia]